MKRALLSLPLTVLMTSMAIPMVRADEATPKVQTQSFADWIYRCQAKAADASGKQTKPARPVCEVAQEMIVHKDNKTVAVLTMAFTRDNSGKGMLVNMIAPLGLLLQQGVAIAVDAGDPSGAKPLSFGFSYCNEKGCWVSAQKADALVAALKPGKVGHARMVMMNGRGLTIDFSLAGFASALAAYEAGGLPKSTSVSN